MISGLVSFESIVESVKDETGFENLSPLYDRMRRLIFRAEREIGYGGSVTLKKMVYTKDVNFNGKYLILPNDFIEFEGVGSNCSPMSEYCYNFGSDGTGIRFKSEHDKIVLLYWGLTCDAFGNPIVTRNHEEAVVMYIVWKLYSQKVFMGEGNFNLKKDYELTFYSLLGQSRGNDAIPTLEQWNAIGQVTYSDVRGLLQHYTASYSYCPDELLPAQCLPVTPESMKVYFWQLSGTVQNFATEQDIVTDEYLATKAVQVFEVFEQGYMVTNTGIGRMAFAIAKTEIQDFALTDALNNDVTDEFESVYLAELQTMLYVSINVMAPSTIYFKFKKLITNA